MQFFANSNAQIFYPPAFTLFFANFFSPSTEMSLSRYTALCNCGSCFVRTSAGDDSIWCRIPIRPIPAFDPANSAVVEQGTTSHYPQAATAAVRIAENSPAEVKLRVESSAPRYLVTSEGIIPDGARSSTHPVILLWSAGVSALACLVLSWLLFAGLWHN